jgi:energy-coupling factor transporter ATP-binding protein EcfA2
MPHSLQIAKLTFRYPRSIRAAIHEFSLDVSAGHCCALLGSTGSGKSTLLHGIAGTLLRDYPGATVLGEMSLNGNRFDPLPPTVLFPAVGLVHQEASLMISGMFESVVDEISLSLQNLSLSHEEEEYRKRWVLHLLNIEHLEQRNPSQLSGGELRKVALATILVAKPKILLLDAPSVGLDQRSQFELARLIQRLKGTTTVIFTESTVELALLAAETIVVLDQGRCLFLGGRKSFLSHLGDFQHILPTEKWQNLFRLLQTPSSIPLTKFVR